MECMDPERWLNIRTILERALETSPAEQAIFLDEACGEDRALRMKVEALLAAEAQAGSFLQAPVGEFAGALVGGWAWEQTRQVQRKMEGHRIGPYRLLKEIGRGGMGTVYLAERGDGQFKKRVALKLVRRGMDTEDILHRFRAERQILAALDHPNIARLFDGGMTEDGLPYFVMEYVEGLPIDHYCDRHKLSINERLHLFCTVCQAVHYAHQNLVVHRDLKPSNILVTGTGQVKLLDFGIAKVLNPEMSIASVAVTRTEIRLMTPAYASPEQVRGEQITTASDVYGLGVLLYELLVGQRPFRFKSHDKHEIAQVVLEKEPPKPSTAIREVKEMLQAGGTTEQIMPQAIAQNRSARIERLRRCLQGDLDNIVLTMLKKEPKRRYRSAAEVEADVQRHLAGLPVTARKDTFAYRMGKFVRRHWVGVIATVLVVLSLVGGLGGALWQARLASQEAAKASAVKNFLVNLFNVSDPSEAREGNVTARELLDEGAEQVETELKGQPEVQAEMMNVLGVIYRELGLYDRAQPLLEKALAMRQRLHRGNGHIVTAESLYDLGKLLHLQGDYDAAVPLLEKALMMRQKLLGETHPSVALSMNSLASSIEYKGDYDAAEPLYRKALTMREKLFGEEHPEVAVSLNNLATLLMRKGDYETAEPHLRKALAMRKKLLGEEHPEVATSLNNLAVVLKNKGDYTAAESLYRAALMLDRKYLGETHPLLATSMINLASLLHKKGDHNEAERLYREVLAMREELLGKEHPDVAQSLYKLATLLHEKDNYDDAERLYRQALILNRKTLGASHATVGLDLRALASLLRDKGEHNKAEPLFQEALDLLRHALPIGHPHLINTLVEYSQLLLGQNRVQEAQGLLREELQIRQESFGDDDGRTAVAKSALGTNLTALGMYENAETLLLESYTTLDIEWGRQHKETQKTRDRLVDLYTAWGKPAQARQYQGMQTNP